ncbi:MAG: FadR/GntR family transcriptional regulator [Pseudomonadota bacterium]
MKTAPARIRKPRVHKEIVEALAQRVITGRWAVGETIPKEAALCSEFGVSRTVIREASRVLVSKGMLVSKPRAGTSVTARTQWSILDPDIAAWLAANGDSHGITTSLVEARRTIEPAAARLAALRASPADLARIHEAWQRMARHADRAAFIEADIDFHTALLVASHNIIFIQLAGVVRSAMSSLFDTTETVGSNPPEALALHLAVVEAVRLRQPDDAVRAMSQILDMAERDLRHAGMDSFL